MNKKQYEAKKSKNKYVKKPKYMLPSAPAEASVAYSENKKSLRAEGFNIDAPENSFFKTQLIRRFTGVI